MCSDIGKLMVRAISIQFLYIFFIDSPHFRMEYEKVTRFLISDIIRNEWWHLSHRYLIDTPHAIFSPYTYAHKWRRYLFFFLFLFFFSLVVANIGSYHNNFHLFQLHVMQIIIFFIFLFYVEDFFFFVVFCVPGSNERKLKICHMQRKIERISKTFGTFLMFTALGFDWNWFEVSSIICFLCWSMSVNESALNTMLNRSIESYTTAEATTT